MHRRLIGAAWLALAMLGCNEDSAELSVADIEKAGSMAPEPPDEFKIPPMLAARDDKPAAKDGKGDDNSAKGLVEKGQRQANGGDLVAAIASFERAHKLDPKDRDALLFLILARQIQSGRLGEGKEQTDMILASAAAARELRAIATDPTPREKGYIAVAIYKEACAFAKGGQPDKAMASLRESVDAGLADERTIANDDDLVALRGRPEFKTLVGRVKDEAKKAMKAQDDAMTAQLMPEVKKDLASFKSFPFGFELPGLDGKPVKLDDFKGKVTIVDIWGTWCPPCRMEIPHFLALRENYKDKGVEIVGINKERVPAAKIKETIESFAKENHMTYPLVIGDDKVEEQVPDFSGYPTTLFLDREGKVRYKHVGYAPYEVIEYVVKTLLAEKGGKPATP
jgi:thiol-disulfide isomerase/thioredoxin